MKKRYLTSLLPLGLSLTMSANAAIISVNFDGSNNVATPNVDSSQLAGAPGVRVANWNAWGNWNSDINTPPILGGAGNPVIVDDSGATVSGFTAEFTGQIRTGQRVTGSGVNDELIFGNQVDTWGGQESVIVSGVPYAQYDVYVYMYDDRDGRAGEFTIGGTTLYARGFGLQATDPEGVGNPADDGTGYVRSFDTTIGSGSDIDQGNYVVFEDLTGSDFTLLLDAVNAGNLDRNKVAGFQIVEVVPEPSSALLITLGAGFGLLGRRRQK